MSKVTQVEVDEAFNKVIKPQWDKMVEESGQSEMMFIALSNDGLATAFLYNYSQAKKQAESLGLIMPELVAGLTVTEVGEDEE